MRTGIGQQALAGLAVLLLVGLTLAGGFILMQSDVAVRLGGISPTTEQPDATALPANGTATHTPTSAILESTTFPTAEPPPPVPNTPIACNYPPGWEPAVVGESASMDSLAALYATTVEALMQGNCLDDPTLQTGQIIFVPPFPEAAEDVCGPPSGWTTYVVKAGENLFRIGLWYGQTVDAMMEANCFTSPQVKAGQTLFVPPVTPLPPTATGRPSSISVTPTEGTPTLVPGCDNPGAQITSPAGGETLVDDIFFYGTAHTEDFSFYKLEIRAANKDEFTTFDGDNEPVIADFLGQVGAYAFTPGDYVIRLAVVDTNSAVVGECSITVTLEGGPTATETAS